MEYKKELIKINITDEGIKPFGNDKFYGELLNNGNYKIYIIKEQLNYVYVGKTKQAIGTKFGQGFSAYLKDINKEVKPDGYAGYKWIKKYLNHESGLDLYVIDLGFDDNNEKSEAIEAEIVFLIRTKYNLWPECQNEIHFNNEHEEALGVAIRIFTIVENYIL